MKKITIKGEEYTLEYSFEAAEYKDIVQQMFDMLSGSYIFKRADENSTKLEQNAALITGTSELMAEIPQTCITAFYAGLLERNPLGHDEAKQLMRQYMRENNLTYNDLYTELKNAMEDDGFFKLSGIQKMFDEINGQVQGQTTKAEPQDHKKPKQTTTK